MRFLILLLAASASLVVRPQGRNMHWVVGDGAHIVHEPNAATVLAPFPFVTAEGQGAISDPEGNLLFIANHQNLYNRQGDIMPNGTGPFTHEPFGDLTQGSIIVPVPGTIDIYEVVYLNSRTYEYWPKAEHLRVDMSLDGGLGDVVPGTHEVFGDSVTEKLTATPHGNGVDYWVLMNRWDTDEFRAYLVSGTGLDTVPVVSHAGSAHTRFYILPNQNNNFQGQMKFNVAGDRIALTTPNSTSPQPAPPITQLFNFDDNTGSVSYRMSFPGHQGCYGIEFSGDGTKLYVSGMDSVEHYVDQYDLSLDDTLAIQNSRTRVYALVHTSLPDPPADRPNALTLGPDGRIYVTRVYSTLSWFAIIDQPDSLGAACNFIWNGLDLAPTSLNGSHCNQLKRYHDSPYAAGIHVPAERPPLNLFPTPISTTTWLDANGLRGPVQVDWHDAIGRIVRTERVTANGFGLLLDARALGDGIYTIHLRQHQQIGAIKAVVQH